MINQAEILSIQWALKQKLLRITLLYFSGHDQIDIIFFALSIPLFDVNRTWNSFYVQSTNWLSLLSYFWKSLFNWQHLSEFHTDLPAMKLCCIGTIACNCKRLLTIVLNWKISTYDSLNSGHGLVKQKQMGLRKLE